MYTIAANLVQDIKDGIIKRHQSRTPTPIEALASGEMFKAPEDPDFKMVELTEWEEVKYETTPKEELEKALREAAEELENSFHAFINKIIESYIGGES